MQGYFNEEKVWVGSDGIDRTDWNLYKMRKIKTRGDDAFFMQLKIKCAKITWGSAPAFTQAVYMTEALSGGRAAIWDDEQNALMTSERWVQKRILVVTKLMFIVDGQPELICRGNSIQNMTQGQSPVDLKESRFRLQELKDNHLTPYGLRLNMTDQQYYLEIKSQKNRVHGLWMMTPSRPRALARGPMRETLNPYA